MRVLDSYHLLSEL